MSEEQKNVTEHNTNCPNCNKVIKKIKCYYRNAKYYCAKQCWKVFKQKQQEEKEKKGE